MEVIGQIALNGVVVWLIMSVLDKLPSPIPAKALPAATSANLRAIYGSIIIGFAVYFFQRSLRSKIYFLHDGILPNEQQVATVPDLNTSDVFQPHPERRNPK